MYLLVAERISTALLFAYLWEIERPHPNHYAGTSQLVTALPLKLKIPLFNLGCGPTQDW